MKVKIVISCWSLGSGAWDEKNASESISIQNSAEDHVEFITSGGGVTLLIDDLERAIAAIKAAGPDDDELDEKREA